MTMKQGNGYNHKLPDIDELTRQYVTEELSAGIIAKKYNVTKGAVLIKLRRYGIPRRSLTDAQRLTGNRIDITPGLYDFMAGLLLGDGSLVLAQTGKSARYSHTDKHRSYLVWLKKELSSFGIKCSTPKTYTSGATYSISSTHYREFVALKKEWYPFGERKIPHNLVLSPIKVFNWFIGDGSTVYHKNKLRVPRVRISKWYDKEGVERMSTQLIAMDISNTVEKDGLYIRTNSVDRFFKYLLSSGLSIPNCYKYKFPEEFLHE